MTSQERNRFADLQEAADTRKLSPAEIEELNRLRKKNQDDEANSSATDDDDYWGGGRSRAPQEGRPSSGQDTLTPLQPENTPPFHGSGFLLVEDDEDGDYKLKVDKGKHTVADLKRAMQEISREMDEEFRAARGQPRSRPGGKRRDDDDDRGL